MVEANGMEDVVGSYGAVNYEDGDFGGGQDTLIATH
jgi:hypothetical protein